MISIREKVKQTMGTTKKDTDILDWLYQQDRKSLGEDVCENEHYFPKGKYDFCPICGRKFKAESEG